MSYYTQTEIINFKILADSILANSKVLQDLIDSDMKSRFKKNMVEAEKYFLGHHDYLDHINYYYPAEGQKVEATLMANNKIPIPFFKFGVKQKKQYLVGEPLRISIEEPTVQNESSPTPDEEAAIAANEEFQTALIKQLGKRFNKLTGNLIENASKKAIEWLHFYIDSNGEFRMVITPAQQIIPIYDEKYEDELIEVIRYYPYQIISFQEDKKIIRYKVEIWTAESVTYYTQNEEGTFLTNLYEGVEIQNHWYMINDMLGIKEGHSWGKVPFVPLCNNAEYVNDLYHIKPLIDAYDKVFSGWANDIEDIKQLLLILKGYNGLSEATKSGMTELEYFIRSLYTYGAIPVDEDGDVTNLKNDIPVEARQKFLDLCKDAIYEIGQMVNPNKLGEGNITNVVIKARYAGLDMKANEMTSEIDTALEQIFWFVVEWMNRSLNKKYDPALIKWTYNLSMIFNDSEIINNLATTTWLSEKTILENDPRVKNVDEEIARLEADRERQAQSGIGSFDKANNNTYDSNGNLITDPNYQGERFDISGQLIQ